MTHYSNRTISQAPDLRTESGSIDYAAYDRLAREERAHAFTSTGRGIVAGIRHLTEKAIALITHRSHGAAAH